MTDYEIRIASLQAAIKDIENTVYPDGYSESKKVMLRALDERIQFIRHMERYSE